MSEPRTPAPLDAVAIMAGVTTARGKELFDEACQEQARRHAAGSLSETPAPARCTEHFPHTGLQCEQPAGHLGAHAHSTDGWSMNYWPVGGPTPETPSLSVSVIAELRRELGEARAEIQRLTAANEEAAWRIREYMR